MTAGCRPPGRPDKGSHEANRDEFVRTGKEQWREAMERHVHVSTATELVQADVDAMLAPKVAWPPQQRQRPRIAPYLTGTFGGLIGVVGTLAVHVTHRNHDGVVIVAVLALFIMLGNMLGLCWELAK